MPKKESNGLKYKILKKLIDDSNSMTTTKYKYSDSKSEEPKPAKKRKPETRGRKKGQRSGKSQKTIQRYNWIRDMLEIVKKKRLAHTLDEFARLILSEMKENTPRFFENNIYKKSTILKVLKNKSWGDD